MNSEQTKFLRRLRNALDKEAQRVTREIIRHARKMDLTNSKDLAKRAELTAEHTENRQLRMEIDRRISELKGKNK
jgi:hypothetical protein